MTSREFDPRRLVVALFAVACFWALVVVGAVTLYRALGGAW